MKDSHPPAHEPAAASSKPLRSDGVEARNRLLDAALQLFAEKGFAKTSTREIAQAAQVNIAAISYYFGDKAGLYRGVFLDPRSHPQPDAALTQARFASLDQALRAILMRFTEPLKQGHLVQSCMRLHFREMLEPTGIWQEEIEHNIKPAQLALVELLRGHLGLAQADDDLHRLALAITGLGLMLHVGCEIIPAVRPQLTATPQSVDTYTERLLSYALSMVRGEADRRALMQVAAPAIGAGAPMAKLTPTNSGADALTDTRILSRNLP